VFRFRLLATTDSLYHLLFEFGISVKLVWLVGMCLNRTYNKVYIGKHLSDAFLVQNNLKQRVLYHHCFSALL
jgi:hypothetical protein